MAFQHPPASGRYYVQLQLPGYGVFRRTSLRTTKKSVATKLEAAIRRTHEYGLASPRFFDLLDAIQGSSRGASGTLSPHDLVVALNHRDGAEVGLNELHMSLNDPPLAEVVADLLSKEAGADGGPGREDRIALPRVVEVSEALYGRNCPASMLLDPVRVGQILNRILKTSKNKRTSVSRYEKRSISNLITRRWGRHERDRVIKNCGFVSGDRRRKLVEAVVTPSAIELLCRELDAGWWQDGDEAASLYVRLACSTGATVSPLSRVTRAQWYPATGQILLRGTKRAKRGERTRDRMVQVPPQLVSQVAEYFDRGDEPDELLFPLTVQRFGSMWTKARKRAGLEQAAMVDGELKPLTPHDLRHVFATYAERSGLATKKIGLAGLGHDDLKSTERYRDATVAIDQAEAGAVAQALGF